MATLSTQNLQIDELTGMPHDVRLTATVTVELNRIERALLKSGEVDFILQSSVWGIDGNLLNGDNDNLFYFSDQTMTREGTYTFSRIVPRHVLNEDHSRFNRDDEISASFSLRCFDRDFPIDTSIMTPIYRGYF
jgi:hypothetical protein